MNILESLHTQIIMLATLKKETENSFCHLIKILLSCIRTFPYVKLGLTIGLTIVIKQLQNGVVIVHSVVRRTSFIKAWFVSTVTFQTNRLVHGGNLIWVRHFCKSFIWSHSQHVWYFRNVDSHKKKNPNKQTAGSLCKLCAGSIKYQYYSADVVQDYVTIILLYNSIFGKKLWWTWRKEQ